MADHLAEELDDAYFDQLEEDLERIMNSEDDPEAEEVLRERALEEQARLQSQLSALCQRLVTHLDTAGLTLARRHLMGSFAAGQT